MTKRIFISAIFIACALMTPRFVRADEIPLSFVSVVQGCKVSLDVLEQESHRRVLQLDLAPYCRIGLGKKISALDGLLGQLKSKGVDFSHLRALKIGRVVQPEWNERIADCFIKGYRIHNDRQRQVDFARRFDKCEVFTELKRVFRKHGLMLSNSSIEELDTVNLAALKERAEDTAFFEPSWMRSHRADKMVVYGGIVFFDLSSSNN